MSSIEFILKKGFVFMRLSACQSYTIAWFKLADFVARGEKERALMVLKLLMHSIQDEAVPYQLEGDVLLAFDDDAALDRYHVAANLYKKSGKIKQAASIYEHVSVFKEDEGILEALFDVYFLLQNDHGMLDTFSRLAKVCLQNNKFDLISHLYYRYLLECQEMLHGLLGIRFVKALILYDTTNKQLHSYLQQTIDMLEQSNKKEDLSIFLSQLEGLNKWLYIYAQEYINNI